MINLFRKRRKKMAADNKALKYTRYAIGEIILVVIGILIALSINNWNTIRLKNKEADSLSKRLLIETKKNKKQLELQISKYTYLQDETLSLLNIIGKDYTTKNEKLLDSLIYGLISTPLLDYHSSTLDEALNTGLISLLQSDSLRLLLYDIPQQMVLIHNFEEEIKRDTENNIIPFLYQEYSLRQMDERFTENLKEKKQSSLEYFDNRIILSMRTFENMVDNKYFLIETQLMGYGELLKVFDETINTIEKGLN